MQSHSARWTIHARVVLGGFSSEHFARPTNHHAKMRCSETRFVITMRQTRGLMISDRGPRISNTATLHALADGHWYRSPPENYRSMPEGFVSHKWFLSWQSHRVHYQGMLFCHDLGIGSKTHRMHESVCAVQAVHGMRLPRSCIAQIIAPASGKVELGLPGFDV